MLRRSFQRLASAWEPWLPAAGSLSGPLGSALPFSHSAAALLPVLQTPSLHPSTLPCAQQLGPALPPPAAPAAASFRLFGPLPAMPGSRSRVSATAATSGRAASRGGGSQPSGPAEQTCPLHAYLLQHGIVDLAPFSSPKHLALSQEAVSSNVEPKVVAVAAEGLSPVQISRLLSANHSTLWCKYGTTFEPNLVLMRRIAVHIQHETHPQAPRLTAVGRMLAGAPVVAALYLRRDHSKVERLVGWLESSLGIGLAQLAGCKTLYQALRVPRDNAQAVCLLLLGQGVPADDVAHVFLSMPAFFQSSPKRLQARLSYLQWELGLDAAAAVQMVVREPRLLTGKLEAILPPFLQFLDAYMGELGAGRRLVCAHPRLGRISTATAERGVRNLAARGYSHERIRAMIAMYPALLILDLGSPTQQQKLDWIATVSPWTLDNFLASARYLMTTTRRLASRLDFMQQHGLEPPSSPATLANHSDARFMSVMRKRLAKQGRELAVADWAAWEAAWLQTEVGKKWGFSPLTY